MTASSASSQAASLALAMLTGVGASWPTDPAANCEAALLQFAIDNGVCALLHDRLPGSDWPEGLRRELRNRAIQSAIWELSHQRTLVRTLDAFGKAGIRPILIKGTALAYSSYPNPALRSRSDTDLIVPEGRHREAQGILSDLGFTAAPAVQGEFVSYQSAHEMRTPEGADHTLDLHWKISNSEVLSRLFTYDELLQDAQGLPGLAPQALGASKVHALLIACMHRCKHKQSPYYVDGTPHQDADRLIWLYDIHLMAGELSPAQWTDATRLALDKGLAAVCVEGMSNARARFGTSYPPEVLRAMSYAGRETPAHYLGAHVLEQRWMDFLALGSPARQARFARELLFPTPGYMHTKYADAAWRWLPWLYLRRATGGALKALARRTAA